MSEELDAAHKSGMEQLRNGEGDYLIHEYDGKLYRTIIKKNEGKTKLICTVVARLIDIKNMGTEDRPAHEYLFSVLGGSCHAPEMRYFKPKNLTSHRTFTTKLMGIVPFAEFLGNKQDFHDFFEKEVDFYWARKD